MARDPELENLCTALIEALKSISIVDELPPYLNTKAREANALANYESLKKTMPNDGLKKFFEARIKSRISVDIDISTKEDLIKEVARLKPAIDRIKSSSFKLMLERFNSAHELAVYLSEYTDAILKTEASQLAALSSKPK